jgi:hypothetical protein
MDAEGQAADLPRHRRVDVALAEHAQRHRDKNDFIVVIPGLVERHRRECEEDRDERGRDDEAEEMGQGDGMRVTRSGE